MTNLLFRNRSISVFDYRCSAGPADKPFVELHDGFTVSYVRKGSFGYHARGKSFELVAGSILVGHPGDEYVCTHDHCCGDECLSFYLSPTLFDTLGIAGEFWRTGGIPPLSGLMVLGELVQAVAEGVRHDRSRRTRHAAGGSLCRGRWRPKTRSAGGGGA